MPLTSWFHPPLKFRSTKSCKSKIRKLQLRIKLNVDDKSHGLSSMTSFLIINVKSVDFGKFTNFQHLSKDKNSFKIPLNFKLLKCELPQRKTHLKYFQNFLRMKSFLYRAIVIFFFINPPFSKEAKYFWMGKILINNNIFINLCLLHKAES